MLPNQCSVSLVSPVAILYQLFGCPEKMEPFKDHPITPGHQTGLKKEASVKADYLTFSK